MPGNGFSREWSLPVPAASKPGLGETLDNQRIMKLVEEALRHPEGERQQFLKGECEKNSSDFEQAWHYVEWEQRMQGFLLEPVIKRDDAELKLAAGDLLHDRFRIVRELAQGGMGVVYEAQDEKLGRRIALKCAKAGFGNELPPEVRHATEVSHPNVCKIYEIHTTRVKQQLVDFITMELLDGETLSSRLRRGRLAQEEVLAIARQVAAGLAEAHRNGVIHGDIKSNNVVLAQSNDGGLRAVITDFGLARRQGSASRGIWGTPGYMAPELWLGEQPSVASDIYALGVVFYEMATGAMPDRSHTSQAMSETLKATPWLEAARQKPPSVNKYWDRILARCLDPAPLKRYQSVDVLAAALAPGHRRRNVLLGAAAALALALTGVITYRSATAPTETVKLAVLPSGDVGAAWLLPDAEREIARLTGTRKTAFALLTPAKVNQATHVLRVSVAKIGEQTALEAVLSDAQSQAPLKTWDGLYRPAEMKYAPQALAGVVSAGLHLTPSPTSGAVNAQAQDYYRAGTDAIRQDSTVDEALKDLENARAADVDSALVLAALAEADWTKYWATKDHTWLERAREAERQSELRYLDTAAGHRAAARLETTDGRFEDAEADLLRALELEPANAETYRRLGYIYQIDNQFDKALRALRQAVELEPNYYRNQWSLGKFYLDQGRYKQAVQYLSETVKMMPSLAKARYELAVAYTDTGEFDKALQNLNALPQLGPDEHFELGTILMYQDKDAAAIPQLLLAVKEAPDQYVFWMQLAIAQQRVGLRKDSDRAVRRGLTLVEQQLVENPRDGIARAFLGYFCARTGQKDRSESETKQALQLDPHQLTVIWMAVHTFEMLGQRDESLAILRTAPAEMLDDLKRWPNMAELTADARFVELTASNAEKKEKRQ
jgi:tetratricopeptide (TPR) repeat protein